MRYLFLVTLACSNLLLNAQAPATDWLRTAGGSSQFVPYRSAIDAVGSIYTAGSGSNIDYGSGVTVVDLGFAVARYNSAGDILWARALASPPFQDETVTGIATNSASDLWIVGTFTSATLALDAFTLTNMGLSSAFMARLDSSGAVQSAIAWGGAGLSTTGAMDVCTDALDNVFVTGTTNAPSLTIDGVTMTNTAGGEQLVTVMFDASGTAVWGSMSAAPTGGANGLCIGADGSGNSYVTGRFDDTLIIDDDTLSTAILDHVALIKYAPDGEAVWMHAVAVCDPLDLAVDGHGNSYVCGDIQTTADFDGDTLVPSVLDGFVSAYTANGSYRWVVGVQGEIDNELCWSAVLDSAQTGLVVGGTFVFWAWFGEDSVHTGIAPTDGFIMHMDTMGGVNWVKDMTGDGPTLYAHAYLDGSDHLYASGVTQSMMSYLGEPVQNGSGNQAFLARFDDFTTSISSPEAGINVHVWPDPTSGTFNVLLPRDTRTVIINDALGHVIRTVSGTVVNELSFQIEEPGLYFLQAIGGTGRSTGKIVVE